MTGRLLLLVAALALGACEQRARSGLDFPQHFPERLSQWHLIEVRGGELTLNAAVVPYDLNSPLFSDYAHKLRTVLVPPGTAMRYGADAFAFPIGTVISKTFYYPRAAPQPSAGRAVRKVHVQAQGEALRLSQVWLLETRLLVNTAAGWVALPYVWNREQTQATLALAGDEIALQLVSDASVTAFTYVVPDVNQCAGCHALRHREQAIEPIGIRARHLNKSYQYAAGSANQLSHWQQLGLLTGGPDLRTAPRNAQWDDGSGAALEARARAYLDINCGHCHSARGAANTSGLLLDASEQDRTRLGLCKTPVAAGRGSGAALFDILPGAPEQSILLYRMNSVEPDVAMPELGRSLVHEEGVALIRAWIATLQGDCTKRD